MATRFRALAVPVDVSTGDRRRIAEGALTHQQLPMPGRWVREDKGAHDGAVAVASVTDVQADGDQLWLTGHWFDDVDEKKTPRLSEDVAEAMHLAREGVVGFSVDLDDIEAVPVRKGTEEAATGDDLINDGDVELLITKGRMRAATLVNIPAYAETNHTIQFLESEDDEAVSEPDDEPNPEPEMASITASVSGDTNLPVGERDVDWDAATATKRIFDAYSDKDGKIDKSKASKAFLWTDGDGSERGYYKLPFADIVDGKLTIIPRGVAAAAGGRGVRRTDLPADAKKAIEGKICSLYAKIEKKYDDWPKCPFDRAEAAAKEHASLTASIETLFSAAAFIPPIKVNRLMPITYDWDRGIAYGHIAPWGICHEGIPGSCVLAPKDGGDYRQFHAHRIETDEGTVYAGRITAGGRHPDTDDGITAHHVRHHHDEMTTVAYVRASEDEFGIFVCGPIVPMLDERTRQILSRRKVSADWRETVDGLSMIEVLALGPGPKALSEPGFPVRVGFAAGRQISLVASLMPAAFLDTRASQVITADMVRSLDMGEAFKVAYREIKSEEKEESERAAEAMRLRVELASVMSADAAKARDDLARALGV